MTRVRARLAAVGLLGVMLIVFAGAMRAQESVARIDRMDQSDTILGAAWEGTGSLQVPEERSSRRGVVRNPYNSDGSPKYSLEGGGGFTTPFGQSADSYAVGFRFQAGVGRNFNRRIGVDLHFDWDGLSVQNSVLSHLLSVYQVACGTVCTGSELAQVFGSSHLWSLSLNPAYTFAGSHRRNAYVVVGAGFYHKVTTFSAPAATSSCNGCPQTPVTARIDGYTSNAPGWSGGVGLRQSISRSEAHFYAEVRFDFVYNQPRAANTAALGPGFNAFPANSQPTHIVPLTLGVRF